MGLVKSISSLVSLFPDVVTAQGVYHSHIKRSVQAIGPVWDEHISRLVTSPRYQGMFLLSRGEGSTDSKSKNGIA